MDWQAVELDPINDPELISRRITYWRNGTRILFPPEELPRVTEVLNLAGIIPGNRPTLDEAVQVDENGNFVVPPGVRDRVTRRTREVLRERAGPVSGERPARPTIVRVGDFLRNPGDESLLVELLEEMAVSKGLKFEVRESLDLAQAVEDRKVVVVPRRRHQRTGASVNAQVVFATKGETAQDVMPINFTFPMPDGEGTLKPNILAVTVLDDQGTAIADTYPGVISLLVSISGERTLWSHDFVKRIFDRALPLVLDRELWQRKFDQQKGLRIERCRTEYMSLVRDRAKREFSAAQTHNTQLMKRRDEVSRQMVEAIRGLESSNMMLDHLKRMDDRFDSHANAEFDKISTTAGIDAMEVTADGFEAVTSPILIDGQWKVGTFRIVVTVGGGVEITNMTNPKHKEGHLWDHPHVQDHRPCWGNIQEGVNKMIAAYSFGAALQLILAYLQTYNPEDIYGKNITLWNDDRIMT